VNAAAFMRHDISEAVKFYPVKRSHKILAPPATAAQTRGERAFRAIREGTGDRGQGTGEKKGNSPESGEERREERIIVIRNS